MAAESIRITVNGEAKQVAGEPSVAALLQLLELPAERVAVELNRAIVRKRDWAETPVRDGAALEIVEFVGGG